MSPPCRPSFRAKPSSRPSSSPSLFRVLHIKQEDSFPLSHTRTLALLHRRRHRLHFLLLLLLSRLNCCRAIGAAPAPAPARTLSSKEGFNGLPAFLPSFLPSFVIERPLTFSPEKSKGEAIGRSVGRLKMKRRLEKWET